MRSTHIRRWEGSASSHEATGLCPPSLFGGGKNQGKETSTHRFMFIREIPSPKGLYLVVLKGHILSVPKSNVPTL